MPRSFLVKTNLNRKKPDYAELEIQAGAVTGDTFPPAEHCAAGLVWDLHVPPGAALRPPVRMETGSSPSSRGSSGDEEEEDGGRTSDPPSPELPRRPRQRSKGRVRGAVPGLSEPSHPTPRRGAFFCKHCAKEYGTLGALKMHIRSHALPCVCPTCGKAFSRPWLLRGHIRTHTGERPFSCPQCSRAFADRSNLRAHLQTHERVKRYQCSSCSRTFSRASLLQKHAASGCSPLPV